jgi:large subunit ribosomal protein L22
MEVQALTRYARMSPKKVREVVRTIQGRKAPEAVQYLELIPRKSARLIASTLRSAIANAQNNNSLSPDTLVVKSAVVENGPVLKRQGHGETPDQEDVPHPHHPLRRPKQLTTPWAKKPIR